MVKKQLAQSQSASAISTVDSVFQGIKFKVIGPPSSQDVIDACAKDAVRYTLIISHSFLFYDLLFCICYLMWAISHVFIILPPPKNFLLGYI